MKAYTDYPLETNPTSGVVEIEVLSYDRNKYAGVRHDGEEEEIKIGYIYKDPACTKTFANIHWLLLPRNPWDKKPTRLEAYREHKKTYRFKKISYALYSKGKKKHYTNLSDALKALSSCERDYALFVNTVNGRGWGGGLLVSREDGHLVISSRRSSSSLKIRHLKKYKIEYYKKG